MPWIFPLKHPFWSGISQLAMFDDRGYSHKMVYPNPQNPAFWAPRTRILLFEGHGITLVPILLIVVHVSILREAGKTKHRKSLPWRSRANDPRDCPIPSWEFPNVVNQKIHRFQIIPQARHIQKIIWMSGISTGGVLSHGSSSKFILVLKPMVTKWALNNQSCSLQPLARIILQLGVFQKREKISAGSFMSKLIWRFAELRLPVEAGSVFFSIKPDLQNATAWSSRNTEI